MQLPHIGRLVRQRFSRRRSRWMPVLAAVFIAGCAAQGGNGPDGTSLNAMSLDEFKREQLRTLTIRCYMEHREALVRSSSAELRLACREWAAERVAVALGPG
jgi:hypothetical protein